MRLSSRGAARGGSLCARRCMGITSDGGWSGAAGEASRPALPCVAAASGVLRCPNACGRPASAPPAAAGRAPRPGPDASPTPPPPLPPASPSPGPCACSSLPTSSLPSSPSSPSSLSSLSASDPNHVPPASDAAWTCPGARARGIQRHGRARDGNHDRCVDHIGFRFNRKCYEAGGRVGERACRKAKPRSPGAEWCPSVSHRPTCGRRANARVGAGERNAGGGRAGGYLQGGADL